MITLVPGYDQERKTTIAMKFVDIATHSECGYAVWKALEEQIERVYCVSTSSVIQLVETIMDDLENDCIDKYNVTEYVRKMIQKYCLPAHSATIVFSKGTIMPIASKLVELRTANKGDQECYSRMCELLKEGVVPFEEAGQFIDKLIGKGKIQSEMMETILVEWTEEHPIKMFVKYKLK